MLHLLACLVAIQVPIEQPPRLRTILDNGAAILVERVPGAKTLAIQFLASSRGTEETPTTNGLRHLLEHLAAKGPKGDIDEKLETAGGFLQAETLREAMHFKLTLPAGQMALGIRTIEQLMQMPVVTPEMIQREAQIIAQESALRDDASKLSAAAWTQAFGDKGLDVMGNLDVIKNATPAMLNKIHRLQFSGPNLAICVVGDVDLDATTKACSEVLSKAPKAEVTKYVRGGAAGGSVAADGAGEVIGLPVPGWRSPETAARVAAAFALASESDNSFVIYTPASNAGMVLLGRLGLKTGLGKVIENAKAAELFANGRSLAKAWVLNMMSTPESVAEFRGMLLVQEYDLKPETILENLDAMTPKDFASALNAFRSPGAIDVVGK